MNTWEKQKTGKKDEKKKEKGGGQEGGNGDSLEKRRDGRN